jgi:hypothetical protein
MVLPAARALMAIEVVLLSRVACFVTQRHDSSSTQQLLYGVFFFLLPLSVEVKIVDFIFIVPLS